MPRGCELSPQDRARIYELRSIGWSLNRIHKQHLEWALSTIRSTIRRAALQDNHVSRPQSGAPQKLTEEQRDYLYDITTY